VSAIITLTKFAEYRWKKLVRDTDRSLTGGVVPAEAGEEAAGAGDVLGDLGAEGLATGE